MSEVYIEVNGRSLSGTLAPSKILPGVEDIKSSVRSLGGKMHMDIADSKQSLQIVFDVLSQTEFEIVKEIFGIENSVNYTNGLRVRYFDTSKTGQMQLRMFLLNQVTFEPLVIESGILWQNVNISLVEI